MTDVADVVRDLPFVDLGRQLAAIGPAVRAAIDEVLDSGTFVLGTQVERFEEEIAAYFGAKFAVGVDSGTSALELSLRAIDIGPGDEVITAANSFVATAMSISHVGAKPVFVDVDHVTRTITAEQVEAAVTARTRAVIPVHLYGHPANMDPVCEVASRHSLAVVEDACQAHGARYRGRRVGSFGTAAAFSFYPSKNLGALGDGGMVVTSDESVAARVRRLRNYGQAAKNNSVEVGYNRRLDELQAAVLRVKLPHLDAWNRARAGLATVYGEALAELPSVTLPSPADWADPVWHLYVVNVESRDRVRRELSAVGVETGVHYPLLIPQQEAYRETGSHLSFPEANWHARTCLSLPMFPEMPPAAPSWWRGPCGGHSPPAHDLHPPPASPGEAERAHGRQPGGGERRRRPPEAAPNRSGRAHRRGRRRVGRAVGRRLDHGSATGRCGARRPAGRRGRRDHRLGSAAGPGGHRHGPLVAA